MTFTTSHFVGFVIADIDWCAEVQITSDRHGTSELITSIGIDLGGGKVTGDIEGDAMKAHGALVEGEWKTFLDIATEAMNRRLPDLLDRHYDDERESIADRRADARRDARMEAEVA